MRKTSSLAFLVAGSSLMIGSILVAGCDGDRLIDTPPDEPTELPGLTSPPCALSASTYRVVSIVTPKSPMDSQAFGTNLDGDPQDRPDNLMGSIMSTNAGNHGPDLDVISNEALGAGTAAWAMRVERCADPADGAYARVTFLRGTSYDSSADVIDAEVGGAVPAVGELDETGGAVELGVANVPISIFFDIDAATAAPMWSTVPAATVTFDGAVVDGAQVSGKLGFALPHDDMAGVVETPLARTLTSWMAADTGCPDACVNAVAGWAAGMDADQDGQVTATEMAMNDFWSSISSSDVDLFAEDDGEQVFWLRHDGIKDCVSFGIRFTAVPVTER